MQNATFDLLPLLYDDVRLNPAPEEAAGEFDLWSIYPDEAGDGAIKYCREFFYRAGRRLSVAVCREPHLPFDVCLTEIECEPLCPGQRTMMFPMIVFESDDTARENFVLWDSTDHWSHPDRALVLEKKVACFLDQRGLDKIVLIGWDYRGLITPIDGIEIEPLPSGDLHGLSDQEYEDLIRRAAAVALSRPGERRWLARRALALGVPIITEEPVNLSPALSREQALGQLRELLT